jgi:selenophosphate synthase
MNGYSKNYFLTRVHDDILKSEEKPRNIFCLGCAVKVPLRPVLYPALKQVKKLLSGKNINIDLGNDAYVFQTKKTIVLHRKIYPVASLKYLTRRSVQKDLKKFRSRSAVILASYMEPVSQSDIARSLSTLFAAVSPDKIPFCVGKGHTIQISKIPEQEFILADYLESTGGGYYGVASNDTIVTIDFNLKHSHWINVHIALNNALNDLYALGVYKDITLYPTYDSIHEKDNRLIRKTMRKYIAGFKKYNYRMIDHGSLGLQLEAVGTTVVGITDKELPRADGLLPGQVLIVTRPVGDFAALLLYIVGNTFGELPESIRKIKMNVLNAMLTPNVEIARVIAGFLPAKGDAFDRSRHITATKDISGEGLSALETLAQASKTDIFIDRIRLNAYESAKLNIPNNTSNTNGAMVIAVDKNLVLLIMARLKKIGAQPWIIGRVGRKHRNPAVFLKKELKERYAFLRKKSTLLFTNGKFV